jgi:ABC-2 type transport system ATP-binding protein
MVLHVEGVEKSYGTVHALRGIDLDVAAGEIIGLVGPNGAGKTSLVSIVAGLRRPDRGRVVVDGIDVARHPDAVGPHLGLAPQELAVYPTLSVFQNVQLFGELAGLRGRDLRTRIAETAEALGLTELMKRRADSLSGGQKRRLHTAMALVHRPPLLLLDEPTTGADVESRNALLALVGRLAAEGAAVCYSTHYLPEVESLGASVVIIDHGQVIARGSIADLVATHASAAVELVFEGPPPEVPHAVAVDGDPSRIRIATADPAVTAAKVLGGLNSHAERLRAVELTRPGLESVYLALTGRKYRGDEEQTSAVAAADDEEEVADVVAP